MDYEKKIKESEEKKRESINEFMNFCQFINSYSANLNKMYLEMYITFNKCMKDVRDNLKKEVINLENKKEGIPNDYFSYILRKIDTIIRDKEDEIEKSMQGIVALIDQQSSIIFKVYALEKKIALHDLSENSYQFILEVKQFLTTLKEFCVNKKEK